MGSLCRHQSRYCKNIMLPISKHILKFRTSASSRAIFLQRHFTSYLSDVKDGPKPALALGAAGLIPFVSAPAILICGGDVTLLKGLLPIVSWWSPMGKVSSCTALYSTILGSVYLVCYPIPDCMACFDGSFTASLSTDGCLRTWCVWLS